MGKSTRVRYQLFLPAGLSERFEALAARPGASKSALLAAALEAMLERRGGDELEQRFAVRLDRLSHQLARIERDGHVQIESLALFVRYMLTVQAPVAEGDEAARAIGRDRFEAFVQQVGRQLAGGRSSLAPEGSE
ncbi:CopG family transcriptional regulator [Sphingomonas sp. ASV193]|uniref:CopG family transcriptional regulator n=1 Tax=Sphingomonas sp. ASV193 TaxID=3144405 RepID=UPI0032E8F70E